MANIEEMDITEKVKNSPILARLVEEVRLEKLAGPSAYNRMHNRHNRSAPRGPWPPRKPEPEPPKPDSEPEDIE